MIRLTSQTPRKIAVVSHASDLYGASRSLLLLLEKMDSKKYNYFVTCPGSGLFVDRIKMSGIPVHIIPMDLFRSSYIKKRVLHAILSRLGVAIYLFRLILLFYRQKPELVYINTIAHASPVLAAKILRIPILVHMRESDYYLTYNNIREKLRIHSILNLPNRFICVSKATKQLLVERGVPLQKITVVYNGVDTDEFKPSIEKRCEYRKKLGIKDKETLVGIVGQINPRKGIDSFIEAANIVYEKYKNCQFIVIGGVTDMSFFKTKVLPLYHNYKLEDCFTFTEFKEDVKGYLAAIDIFVNASRREPFARVNLEAMAMEKPIIATNTGGNPEAVMDGETGCIIPVGDQQILAERILEWIKESDLRKKFGKAAKQRVEKYFTINHYYKGVERVLNQMLMNNQEDN